MVSILPEIMFCEFLFLFCKESASATHAHISASVFADAKDFREMVILTYFQSYILLNAFIYCYTAFS